MGGDTYNGDTTSSSQQPGLLDQNWDLGYKNDGKPIKSLIHDQLDNQKSFIDPFSVENGHAQLVATR